MTGQLLQVGAREAPAAETLFDRVPAVYAFYREHLFRDDTDLIARMLWPDAGPARGTVVAELGCGPGLYARQLASRFESLSVIGVDRSPAQLERARRRATVAGLANCRFERADAAALPYPDDSLDAVVASRFLGVVEDRASVLAEIARVLRPGGRCFVAEPRSRWRAGLAFNVMRLAAGIMDGRRRPGAASGHGRVEVLEPPRFEQMIRRGPWSRVELWRDRGYQYALLEKASDPR